VLAKREVDVHAAFAASRGGGSSSSAAAPPVRHPSGIIVVDKVEHQLPLASIEISQPTEEVRRAANLARRAVAAAASVKAAAELGMMKARTMKLLMMGDVSEASDVYNAAVADLSKGEITKQLHGDDGSRQPRRLPAWAHELRFYLRDLPREHVEALFPGVIPVEQDTDANGRLTWRHSPHFTWPPCAASLASGGAGRKDLAPPPTEQDELFYVSSGATHEVDAQVLVREAEAAQAAADKAEAHARRVTQKVAGRARRKRVAVGTPAMATAAAEASSAATSVGAPQRHAPALHVASHATGATPRATVNAVMRELAAMRGHAEFTVTLPDESDLMRWRVEMPPPAGSELESRIRQVGHSSVLLEVTFGFDHPASPPFIRVVSPRFAFHTGHVTVGGSICTELLTTKGWNASYTMEATLVIVRDTIVSGGGAPDPTRAHIPYTEIEARSAFLRVARFHGWE
jgi:ubiquitin-protein ligase